MTGREQGAQVEARTLSASDREYGCCDGLYGLHAPWCPTRTDLVTLTGGGASS